MKNILKLGLVVGVAAAVLAVPVMAQIRPTAMPEPSTFMLLASGLGGLAVLRRTLFKR